MRLCRGIARRIWRLAHTHRLPEDAPQARADVHEFRASPYSATLGACGNKVARKKLSQRKQSWTSLPPPSRRELRRKDFCAKWRAVDWSKKDFELASETGLSRKRIRKIRQQVGAPKPPHHRWMRKSVLALK